MKARWIIVAVSVAIFFGGNLFTSLRDPWFQNLNRPEWLTFESLIPLIWAIVWISGTISAILVWEKSRRHSRDRPWLLMGLYIAIALLTTLYSPVVVELRSLFGGLIFGGLATLLAYIIAISVRKISTTASWLLLPYMLWGPIGTYLTWVLIQLNSGAAGV